MSNLGGHVVIVGAGHAGGSCAALLRQLGWTGPVTLIGEEPLPPYQRPPLSKAWLKGQATGESLALKPERFYAQSGIVLRTGVRAITIDRAGQIVTLSDGEAIGYDRLIVATGSRLRRLEAPGRDLGGILELRTAADADRIKAALAPGVRLTVVGGGYIGLEVAASARALGAEVALVEREERLLARVASGPISTFFHKLHRDNGVSIITSATVSSFDGRNGHVTAVRLADGTALPCDIAVVGIGTLADDGLATGAGLATENGVVVDMNARTSDPHIYAIGDCTRRPLPHFGRPWRLESVPNALEQAKQAAHHLCGRPPPAPDVPWFWSDQYEIKLQIAGLPFEVARIVTRGDPASAKFAAFHLDGEGRLRCVEAVNAGAEFMAGRQLIDRGVPIDSSRLADPAVSMKILLSGS